MHVFCLNCQNAIDATLEGSIVDVLCPVCGSTFRVDGDASTVGWRPQGGQRMFGRFAVVECVGAGAFGTVYLARDTELDRMVAVKVPRSGSLTSAQDRDRFL